MLAQNEVKLSTIAETQKKVADGNYAMPNPNGRKARELMASKNKSFVTQMDCLFERVVTINEEDVTHLLMLTIDGYKVRIPAEQVANLYDNCKVKLSAATMPNGMAFLQFDSIMLEQNGQNVAIDTATLEQLKKDGKITVS